MARPVLRWIGYVAGALVVLLILFAATVYAVSSARLSRTYEIVPEQVAIPGDSATIARGEHLARSRLGCADCHGPDLSGGPVVESDMFGHFIAPNLTRGEGGLGARFTDADWIRSVRHGVKPDGRPVVFMPSDEFSRLSEDDLAAVIAFVKQVPPVDGAQPASRLGPIARALVTFNPRVLPAAAIDHASPIPAAPMAEVSPRYGEYLASTGGCRGCHGPDLAGAKPMEPGGVPPANLTPGGPLATWSESDFVRALREGVRPDGTTLSPSMPWKAMGRMNDLELHALYAYLKSIPPKSGKA